MFYKHGDEKVMGTIAKLFKIVCEGTKIISIRLSIYFEINLKKLLHQMEFL